MYNFAPSARGRPPPPRVFPTEQHMPRTQGARNVGLPKRYRCNHSLPLDATRDGVYEGVSIGMGNALHPDFAVKG